MARLEPVTVVTENQATSNFHLSSPCSLETAFPINLIRAKYTPMCLLIYLANYLIGLLATVSEESD